MLTNEDINKIKLMRYRGGTIRGIAEKLSICTRTVQKHLKTDQKQPKAIILIDEIEALKEIVKDQESRIKALESLQPEPEKNKDQESITNSTEVTQQKEELKNHDPIIEKKYITVKELAERTGYKERTLQNKCKNLGYNKVNRHYMIPIEDVEKFEKK